jgi:hypothetical protein
MDGQRFDEVTKVLATGTSRRTVLRTVLGGMSAGLLALAGVTETDAAGKRSCVEGCKKQFGPGRKRGQCISACAKGKGAPPVPDFCGGIGNLPCPEGFTCVDDPNDDCDPDRGADCGGICVPSEGPGGVTCGQTTCPPGVPCCNPSCGICGESCIQIECPG